MATKTTKLQTYSIRREWMVTYCSYTKLKASSVEEACKLALEADDYGDQESMDGGDSGTWIGRIECNGMRVDVPSGYHEEDLG